MLDAAIGPSGFNLAALFPGAFLVLQSDLGLVYGTTMRAQGTTPPTITLSGSLTGPPGPIRIEPTSTITPWSGQISYDGGATFPQTFANSTLPIALTGAPGLTANIGAGSASLDNVWQATCSQWTDQSGNGQHATQATPASQPTIGVGLNGKPSLIFDGVDDSFVSPPAFTPPLGSLQYFVFRWVTCVGFPYICDDSLASNGRAILAFNVPGQVSLFNGAQLNGGVLPVGSFGRVAAVFDNTASTSIKVGALATVTGTAGTFAINAGRVIARRGDSDPTTFGNIELFAIVWAPNGSYAAADAAINSAQGYGPGAILV